MYRIFLVEDDPLICDLVCENLKKWGFEVQVPQNFEQVLEEFIKFHAHLVLMDINLPSYDGFFFAEKIRQISNVPIIFLSSRTGNMDMVMAMNMGGDDFVTKPFSSEILLAKIRALIRRTYDYANNISEFLEHKGLILNLSDYSITFEGQKEELTKNEFRILTLLMKNKGEILSRDEIMRALWEDESFVDDNTLTVNMNRLRKKLQSIGLYDYIVTKKGEGYYMP